MKGYLSRISETSGLDAKGTTGEDAGLPVFTLKGYLFLYGLKDIFIWSHKMILSCFIQKYGNSTHAFSRFLKWEISADLGPRTRKDRSTLGSKSFCNFR